LKKDVTEAMDDLEPTKAARAIQVFVDDQLSNWYVRLNRRRFWKGEMSDDKQAAFDTLFVCLEQIAQMMSPVAPFFADWLYRNLHGGDQQSVFLTDWTSLPDQWYQKDLNERMELAQTITSLILSIRKKVNIKVRQPLIRALVPVLDSRIRRQIESVSELIQSETNIKTLELVEDTRGLVTKKVKPDFKQLGARLGGKMKALKLLLENFWRR
jgi:isoleucyl-tRNA synthetase